MTSLLAVISIIIALIIRGRYFKLSILLSVVSIVLIVIVGFAAPNTIRTCNDQMVSGGCTLKVTSNFWVYTPFLVEVFAILLNVAAIVLSYIKPISGSNAVKGARIVLYIFLGLVAAFAILIIGALDTATYHGEKNIAYIQSQYYKAFDNNSLRYAYITCIEGNLDTPDYCSFTLDTNDPQLDVSNLSAKLINDGYVVTTKHRLSTTNYIATNAKTNMNFYYSANVQDGRINITVSRASNPYN
jgi:hypothetical protein